MDENIIDEYSCFIPLFYIKPQLSRGTTVPRCVALYLYSTSNHNVRVAKWPSRRLLYTFILHQTTTLEFLGCKGQKLLYTFILHQTTTELRKLRLSWRCFIPLFYIKPQRERMAGEKCRSCFIPLFYIKPQQHLPARPRHLRCFIPLFYIKPQQV